MTRYTKTVLTIYFVLGITMLPLALIAMLIKRYIFEDKEVFKPENRNQFIFDLFCVAT